MNVLPLLLAAALALAGCAGKPSPTSSGSTSPAPTSASASDTVSPPVTLPPTPASDGGPSGSNKPTGSTPAAPPAATPGASGTPTSAATPTSTGSATSTSTTSATTSTAPTLGPPAPIVSTCRIALAGLPGTTGACDPGPFVSSTGAPFHSVVVQVAQDATTMPASVLVQVKDAAGNVLASASGLGPLQITLPGAEVPATPTLDLGGVVSVSGAFAGYSATLTFTVG